MPLRSAAVLGLVGMLGALGGCATMVRGTTQDIQVSTDPAGAECSVLDGTSAVAELALTPGYVRVERTTRTLALQCRREGFLDSGAVLEPGIDQGQVGAATMGALGGLQGTVGASLTTTALSAVLPAAVAATAALVMTVASAASFAVDVMSGALFAYPETVGLTLVPASFADAAERDAFFDHERARLTEQATARRRDTAGMCSHVRCPSELTRIDDALKTQLETLERLRIDARLRSP